MRKVLIVLAIVTLLLTQRHAADAGKGGSSFRGGSSSSSSSHSSSSAGRSYSSGGKSYSSGGSGYSSAGNKGYSSGGSSSPPSAGKTATSGNSFSAPSGKTYSSGGKSTSSVAGATSSAPKSSYSSPGGKSYSAGSSSSSTGISRPSTSASAATPRAPVAYDSLPAAEQKKAESRKAYVAAQEPKKTYTPSPSPSPSPSASSGTPKPIDPKDRQIIELRNQLDHERWVNRLPRAQVFYGSYYTRPLVYYNDPYNSFFWWWLLDRSLDDRAYWAYHHRYDMDDARYQALLARDAALQARIAQLESQNIQRDRAYVPPDLKDNPDLMYSDDYVNAVYNPQPAPTVYPPVPYHPTSYSDSGPSGGSAFGQVLFTLFLILLVGAFIGLVVWLVFCKRWNI
jgi:hypothetical protein